MNTCNIYTQVILLYRNKWEIYRSLFEYDIFTWDNFIDDREKNNSSFLCPFINFYKESRILHLQGF